MVAVPSTYSKTSELQLIKNGFKIVIYANHMMRASYPAMLKAAKKILISKKSSPIEKQITPIKEILTLIDAKSFEEVILFSKQVPSLLDLFNKLKSSFI